MRRPLATSLIAVAVVAGSLLALPFASSASAATGLVIPAGDTSTLSDATFNACDALQYGYQLNSGTNVIVDSQPVQCGNTSSPRSARGTTIGPFPTAMLLRIVLIDDTAPSYTFYSDGSHALVSGSNPWTIDITDSDFGASPPSVSRPPPGRGQGNLSVTLTMAHVQGGGSVSCSGSQSCDATASASASVTSPGLNVEVTGRPSTGTGTVDLTITVGTLQCPNALPGTLVSTETNTGFASTDPLIVTVTYSLAAATSPEQTCFNSTVPFVSQSNPTVPKAGTALLLSCSAVTAKTHSACQLSSKQVGTNIVVQDRFYAGDPTFCIVMPTGKGRQTWLSRLAKGMVGKPFDAQFQSSGGKSPVSWKVASGKLPPGCTLNARAGTITGTPTAKGSFAVVVQVTDSERPPQTAKMSVPITVK